MSAETGKTVERSSTWRQTRMLALFDEFGLAEVLEAASEYVRRKRVLDLTVSAGKVTAKVQNAEARPFRTVISFPQLNETQWEQVFPHLAGRSLFIASLLAGDLPQQIEEAFEAAGTHLFPAAGAEMRLYCDCGMPNLCPHLGALALRLSDLVEEDPFAIFTLRGRGKDELLLQIGRHRAALQESVAEKPARTTETTSHTLSPQMAAEFWRARPEIFALQYSIRADELPAAALRQLDPIPLGLPEEEVERVFEEIYSHVARRAQAYGLGFRSGS